MYIDKLFQGVQIRETGKTLREAIPRIKNPIRQEVFERFNSGSFLLEAEIVAAKARFRLIFKDIFQARLKFTNFKCSNNILPVAPKFKGRKAKVR